MIPLEIAIPIATALVGAIAVLWRQLLAERRHAQEIQAKASERLEQALAEERERASELADDWRRRWKEELRKRRTDSELYLRSLGRRHAITSSRPPPSEAPAEAEAPPEFPTLPRPPPPRRR